jgi:hypothetical protein
MLPDSGLSQARLVVDENEYQQRDTLWKQKKKLASVAILKTGLNQIIINLQ